MSGGGGTVIGQLSCVGSKIFTVIATDGKKEREEVLSLFRTYTCVCWCNDVEPISGEELQPNCRKLSLIVPPLRRSHWLSTT